MTRALIVAALVGLTGCAMIVEQNFNSCFFEAERMTANVVDAKAQRLRRDDYAYACMKAHGFDLVNETAEKGKASSYKRVRWL